MVIEAARNENQLLLISNGTAGTGKSHTICGNFTALGREDVIRGSFTAKASFLICGFILNSFF